MPSDTQNIFTIYTPVFAKSWSLTSVSMTGWRTHRSSASWCNLAYISNSNNSLGKLLERLLKFVGIVCTSQKYALHRKSSVESFKMSQLMVKMKTCCLFTQVGSRNRVNGFCVRHFAGRKWTWIFSPSSRWLIRYPESLWEVQSS